VKLTPKQAGEIVGVSPSLIYDWCAEGLPHYRFGRKGRRGRILIEESDLQAWVEKMKVNSPRPRVSSVVLFSELDPDRLAKAWG